MHFGFSYVGLIFGTDQSIKDATTESIANYPDLKSIYSNQREIFIKIL